MAIQYSDPTQNPVKKALLKQQGIDGPDPTSSLTSGTGDGSATPGVLATPPDYGPVTPDPGPAPVLPPQVGGGGLPPSTNPSTGRIPPVPNGAPGSPPEWHTGDTSLMSGPLPLPGTEQPPPLPTGAPGALPTQGPPKLTHTGTSGLPLDGTVGGGPVAPDTGLTGAAKLPGGASTDLTGSLTNSLVAPPTQPGQPWAPTTPAPAEPAPAPAPTPTTPTTPTGTYDATTDYSDPNNIRGFFQSKGITDPAQLDRLVNTWSTYRQQPAFANDLPYFFQRMSQEDDLTGNHVPAGGGGTGGSTTPAAGSLATPATSPFTDEIRRQLLDRIAQDSTPFDPSTDPGVTSAMTGAQMTADRQTEMERRALSEQLFAGGDLNSGTKDQQVQQSSERNAASLSTLKGTLILKEVDARRTDLTNLLQQAIASGDADLARQTQVALANLQAQLTREGYGWAWAQFQAQQNASAVR